MRKQTAAHPIESFDAPSSIQRGVPLKELLDARLVALIGQSFHNVVPHFDCRQFQKQAAQGLETLELKERAAHIAKVLAAHLPSDFNEALPLLIRSFGPPLQNVEGNGLAVFFYLPHSHYIAEYGVQTFESGMTANYEITQRFSAEFSIRPFVIAHRDKCLELLHSWAKDENVHVRRLVSEGTRPRLPWAMRLPEVQTNPQLTLPLLDVLKNDSEIYVRRSVANHLGDIAKDHPDVVYDVCQQWLKETKHLDETLAENRLWMIRHALRHPAKQQCPKALRLRSLAVSRKRGNRGSPDE